MSYSQFHLIFNAPLLLFLGILVTVYEIPWAEMLPTMGIVLAIVVVFTSPWDNYAVWRGIWDFPDDRLVGRVGWLPIEEYAFFVIQTVQVMLLTALWIHWSPDVMTQYQVGWGGPVFLGSMGVLWGFWLVLGLGMRGRLPKRWNYGWHLLYWFVPVILVQWIIGWPILMDRWVWVLGPTLIVGTWLCFADLMAIWKGIWFFDEEQITGWRLKGIMPWEEIAFFYLTSWLVAQSFLILLPEPLR